MKTKVYQRPTTNVVKLQHQCHIMAASSYETSGEGRTSINAMEDDEDL